MNTRRNKNVKEKAAEVDTSKLHNEHKIKKRERSRGKEMLQKKDDSTETRNDNIHRDDSLSENNIYKISIISTSKVLLENFIDQEIDQM